MKQHISIEQLNELSDKGKERLREWWKPSLYDVVLDNGEIGVIQDVVEYGFYLDSENQWIIFTDSPKHPFKALPLLSIGQMIELIADFTELKDGRDWWGMCVIKDWMVDDPIFYKPEELVDALWEATKEILNQE